MANRGPIKILTPLNGGTGVAAKPSSSKGMLESPAFDAGDSVNIALGVSLAKTNTPVVTTTMPAGSLQLEASVDGNAWAVLGTPAPIAVTTERVAQLVVTGRSHRYFKARYIPTGAVTAVGTLQTMGATAPGAGVVGIEFTPDGLFCAMTVATAVNFDLYPFAQTTTSLGTQVTATAGGGTPAAGALSCNPVISNAYYFAVGGGSTPYASIQPVTLAGVAGTNIAISPALAGACKDVHWHPTGYFLAMAHTTTPFLRIHSFDPTTGVLGRAITTPIPDVGDATGCQFSPDGNWLLVTGGTSPYVRMYHLQYNTAAGTMSVDETLPNPTTLPAAAVIRAAWHPTGNRFIAVASATAVNEYTFYRKSVNAEHPFFGSYSGVIGPKIPLSAAAVAPTNVAYSPDGAHVAYTTATTPFLDIYPIKDQGTANNARLTTITALVGGTSYSAVKWSPNMQYIVMGGAGGTIFQQIAPWILPVQMGAVWSRSP